MHKLGVAFDCFMGVGVAMVTEYIEQMKGWHGQLVFDWELPFAA